jgi:outer membrane protein OmpA-like peptidoglycan-associated protein
LIIFKKKKFSLSINVSLMKYLSIILWLLLGFLYWWIWNSNTGSCCDANGMLLSQTAMVKDSATLAEEAQFALTEKRKKESEAAKIAIESADKTNEVTTTISSDDVTGERKLSFYFPINSTEVRYSEGAEKDIKDIVDYATSAGKKIRIVGHTDNTGDLESNMVLGQGRADEVKKKFLEQGVSPTLIEAISRGQNDPIATNNTASGRAQNRRVVLTIQ